MLLKQVTVSYCDCYVFEKARFSIFLPAILQIKGGEAICEDEGEEETVDTSHQAFGARGVAVDGAAVAHAEPHEAEQRQGVAAQHESRQTVGKTKLRVVDAARAAVDVSVELVPLRFLL